MKKLVSLLLALCLIGTVSALCAESESGYADVKATDWYYSNVTTVTQRGLMNGQDDGLFHPADAVNRATVVVVLWRIEGCPAPKNENWHTESAFVDVNGTDPLSPSYWYAEAVAWAKENGIATGYEDGSFLGARSITRQELAVFLYRYSTYKQETTAKGNLSRYPDADKIADWAETAMAHVVGLGLIQGNDENRLDPNGSAQRCQLATILVRLTTPVAG